MNFVLKSSPIPADALFVLLYKGEKLPSFLKNSLSPFGFKQVEARLKTKDFEAESGQMLTIFFEKDSWKRLILVGRGEKKNLLPQALEHLGGKIIAAAKQAKSKKIAAYIDEQDFSELGYGLALGSYAFTRYKKDSHKSPQVEQIQIIAPTNAVNQKRIQDLNIFKGAADPLRDLINTPACDLTPMQIADEAKKVGKKFKIKVTVLDQKALKKIGCNALLGVGKGSTNPPCLVVMEYKHQSKAKNAQLAFIGKGISFDSGGLNLKPTGHIETMKLDMAGAATVIGTMQALAESKTKGFFLGILACAENALSDRAQRPGDIVKAYNGKTIEIMNTDAEGRLVLADALAYTEKKFQPKQMVDIATLTGAVTVALGYQITGVMGTDEKLLDNLMKASKEVHERLWVLPLDADFVKGTEGEISDVKNATDGVRAGAIMGAAFLKNFVEKTPWAHLDIGGTGWAEKPSSSISYGGTAACLRTLVQLGKMLGA